jgi:hypothetical protein
MTTVSEAPTEANPNSGTGEGFLAFFDYLINRKEMVETTAVALRTGSKNVLGVEDDLAALDLRTANVDEIVRRWRNHSRGKMKDRSIEQYEQRFRQSVEMYRKWLNDDPEWLGSRRAKAAPSSTNGGPRRTARATAPTAAPSESRSEAAALDEPPVAGMISYPLPLRPGLQARLLLPEDLTRNEAKRVMNFVNALAFDEQLAITSGTETE